MYVFRTIEPFVVSASRQFPVLVVTGACQVGKTTFLKKMSQGEREYLSLDDPICGSWPGGIPPFFSSGLLRPS